MFRSALSLTIHKEGTVDEADVDDLIDRYKRRKGIIIDKPAYMQAVAAAVIHYHSRQKCLMVCTDTPCLEKTFLNTGETSAEKLSKQIACPVETTGCHWECEQAPVLTLKNGTDITRFYKCSSERFFSDAWSKLSHDESV